jgi:hypothetical protein
MHTGLLPEFYRIFNPDGTGRTNRTVESVLATCSFHDVLKHPAGLYEGVWIVGGPTTSALKSNLTGGAVSCLAQLTAWYAGTRLNLVTATDAAYANAWMFQNAGNTASPTTLTTPASTSQLTGGFKCLRRGPWPILLC